MDQNSGSWKEKIILLLEEGTQWIAEHKKIAIPAALIVVIALVAGVVVFSRGKSTEEGEDEIAQSDEESLDYSVPLEENAVAAVNEFMNRYYAALADGDVDTIAGMMNYISDNDRLRIEKKSEYIERYDNIICYTKEGLTDGAYLVYAYNEVKFYDYDTPVPALTTFALFKNESGEYYIYEGDLDDNTFSYYTELSAQDDVTNLCNTVQAQYNETVGADSELAEFMDGFPGLIKDEVAQAMAEMEQEGEEEPQEASAEEEPEEEENTSEPKAKVTEVETTDTVNVRSSDSETADKIGKAEKGTKLPLIEKKGNGWSKVTFEGKEAFIKSEYLVDIVNVVDDTDTQTAQQEEPQQPEPQQSSNSTGLVGSNGKVTAKTTVNVRASANENGERLGVIYQGDTLELVMQQADGWCKVKYNGQTAFVKTEFVE